MDLLEATKIVVKNESDLEHSVNIETNVIVQPIEEMLGSVTTYNIDDLHGSNKNCQQLRTSARVFKKMKLDSSLALTTSPVVEKEKKVVTETATPEAKPKNKKPFRPMWSAEDKDMFFEALNEHGKDFDAIQQHLYNKLKKKGLPDSQIKTKDQIRHFFHRTWHKVSKHLKFTEDIKKIAQELYALINYGELRKKVGSVNEKICMKLNELIYRGTVVIRVKGKNIRIKTPMCRALRKLNQLDEKHEDLKLPTRVLVELRPKSMATWLNVQFMSQNPRIRLHLPLQKRLSALLTHINEKWKSNLTKVHEQIHSYTHTEPPVPCTEGPILRVTPKVSAAVELPTFNITEYLTSHRICLNAYEERIGVKIPGEQVWQDMCASFKSTGRSTAKKTAGKRQRNESTGEKTPIKPKENCDEYDDNPTPTTVSDVVDTAINTILSLQTTEADDSVKPETKQEHDKEPLSKDEQIQRIRNGWTLHDCGTLSIGEMYLMFGHDSKLELEYSWDPPELKSEPDHSTEPEETKILPSSNELSATLKKLLSLAKLHYRKERIRCPCGHICGGPKANSTTRSKTVSKTTQKECGKSSQNCMRNVTVKSEPMFRKPAIYPSNGPGTDFRAQLDSLQRMRPKYTNRKGRPVRSKHVVVERMLPLLPKPPLNGHSLVTMKVITQEKTLRPIAPRVEETLEPPEETIIDSSQEIEQTFFTSIEETVANPGEKTPEKRISSPTSISNFLDLELQGSDTSDLISGKSLTSFAGLLSDDNPDISTPMSSPSRILKENENQWLNSEVNDYSLTSLLGHLESPMKTATAVVSCDETPISQDIDAQFPSLLGENGVDFVDQFVDMAAQVDPDS